MASNYEKICEENRLRYGTDIGRIGPMLLADRYDDRTHFIFELLQNAEDALGRRGTWDGERRVTFELTSNCLELSHFGRPFDEADVRGVCGIAQSTKGKFSIGRFGIGFKSVYTFTNSPEIHSGDEDFLVENYVQPRRADHRERGPDETLIVLPLKPDDKCAQAEIAKGFKNLGPDALLFLRHIDEINWHVQGGESGVYLRSSPVPLDKNVHRITVIGQESGKSEVDQHWLVFHQDVFSAEGEGVGRVEIAFSLHPIKDAPGKWSIKPVPTSPLVVFFPTVLLTNLGFLIQGPYRTTPSRDNISQGDSWNQHLLKETSSLLVQAMRWLRDNAMLDIGALRCLPLESKKFLEGSRFRPLFDAVRSALIQEELLPRFGGGYVAAPHAKLARTQDLRVLLSPEQLATLFGSGISTWFSADITQDRTPDIHQYLIRELELDEVTPMKVVPLLNQAFLEAQSDEWILRLYDFLSNQEATVRRYLDTIPLIRLRDGSHVVAHENGKAKAFLPSSFETSFPTVRDAVCTNAQVRIFLVSLGISEPDPVDDVVRNILPKYQQDKVDGNIDTYSADIDRILSAFGTDSKNQRDKLVLALRETTFVMVVDTCAGRRYAARPENIYIATDRLKQLFAGVSGVYIVDDSLDCLRGESMREMLEACGALRYPRPLDAPNGLTMEERMALRRQNGFEERSTKGRIVDWTLQGFEALISLLPILKPQERRERARLIWESLADLEERRGRGIFEGSLSWSYYSERRTLPFPAAFLRHLNKAAWVPDAKGELVPPGIVVFESLDWKPNPFLQTKLAFKPPIIDQLAKEAGIDPAALDLLRTLGITNVADLASRLGLPSQPAQAGTESDLNAETVSHGSADIDVYGNAKDLYGDDMPDIPPGTHDFEGGDSDTGRTKHGNQPGNTLGSYQGGGLKLGGTPKESNGQTAGDGKVGGGIGKRSPAHSGGRLFISYVGVHPNDNESDPDGLDQGARMQIEEQAIELIIDREPMLQRTPEGNPGFDLFETDTSDNKVRWVEVKSMTGCLEDRPVGLSRTQFDFAREHGAAYWLYIVEYAKDPGRARVLRIQDPLAHAKTFTFDCGWSQIAQTR